MSSSRQLYFDLMKLCLTNWIYAESELEEYPPQTELERALRDGLAAKNVRLMQPKPFDAEARRRGSEIPQTAHTMVGLERLNNIQQCVEEILANDVPGDFIETGVWRGGASIFMRALLKGYEVDDRCVWVADSFEGLPPPDVENYPQDKGIDLHLAPGLAISLEQVQSNFAAYDLLDEQVHFIKGWFSQTLPSAPVSRLALLRLDGDLYESTMVALEGLYPKLSVGGYVIVDDYGAIEACKQAVLDYRDRHGITDEIRMIDWTGAYWKRSR